MSDSEQEAPRRWRRFSEEFKRDAVRLVVEEGYSRQAAATAVGVSEQSLRAWHAKFAPAPLVTAAGILGFRYCDEAGAVSYELIFVAQLGAVVLGRPSRIARGPWLLVVLALTVPVVTLLPALAWAWGRPILDMTEMVWYHGLVNAVGHVGLGLAAFGWGRPPSHSPIQNIALWAPQG